MLLKRVKQKQNKKIVLYAQKPWPILHSKLLHILCQDFLDKNVEKEVAAYIKCLFFLHFGLKLPKNIDVQIRHLT